MERYTIGSAQEKKDASGELWAGESALSTSISSFFGFA